MGIDEVLTAPHAPWQNAFVERFVGSARRECFDHVIVFNEAGLRKLMLRYCSYYERSPTHLRWTRTRRFLVRLCRPVMATSWRSPRPGASTIGTNGARPERPSHRPLVRHERPALTPTHGPQWQHTSRRTFSQVATVPRHPHLGVFFQTTKEAVRDDVGVC